MNRESAIRALALETFDILIIGGGATGLGCALDAASRGYRTALVEAHDFAQGTSSRSTKLAHGGVRYLRQGDVALVREALHERERMRANAPGLVRELAFFVPAPNLVNRLYYAAGLKMYDALAGKSSFPPSGMVRGGVVYWDAQFDDARYAIALAQTAARHGAVAANYTRATALQSAGGRLTGALVRDRETGAELLIRARCVVNATGVFADEIRRLDDPESRPLITFSRGTHIVVAGSVAGDGRALLVPRTDDGRVLFAIPWHGHTLVGTTDIPAPRAEIDPAPTSQEISYLIATVNRYLPHPFDRRDIRSAFAGLRPLIHRANTATARISREHALDISPRGLVTIAGGKWTTYRRMAEDAIDCAERQMRTTHRTCVTLDLPLVEESTLAQMPSAERVAHFVRHEMARTVEDVLARRTPVLFVDAAAAGEAAPTVASALAQALQRPAEWQAAQAREFQAIARRYAVNAYANTAV